MFCQFQQPVSADELIIHFSYMNALSSPIGLELFKYYHS